MRVRFGIRFVNREGVGIEGAKITVYYPIALADRDHTDEDGWAHFDTSCEPFSGVSANIHINDSPYAEKLWIEDGDSFSFTKGGFLKYYD